MARRRRLGPARPELSAPDAPAPAGRAAAAPIAQIAGAEAAEAALQEVTRNLDMAREDGRLVLEIPLEEIDTAHLARDRIGFDEEEMAALVESIRAHGQRTPVEVTPLSDGTRPWGLISGWRRHAALARLREETGSARFSAVRALVRRADGAAAAYVAMVEENEIRAGLSYYERARIAAVTAAQGLFPDERAAIATLFASASRAKRSKIASFLEIHRHLGDLLHFPAHIPERLGLRLAEALRTEPGVEMLRLGLPPEPRETPAQELAAIARVLDGDDGARVSRAKQPGEEVAPGLRLSVRESRGRLTLRLEGEGVDNALRARVEAALRAALAQRG